MSVAKALATELSEEAVGTRKVLERVPTDKFSWQPHEKSITFGKLASHIAYTPGWVATIVGMDELVTDADSAPPPGAGSTEELLKTFDDKVKEALLILENATDDTLAANWRMKSGDTVVVDMPRDGTVRKYVLNHMIHHRGQLTVYLRENGIPLPALYGPSADKEGW